MPLAQDSRPLVDFTLAPLWTDQGLPLAVIGILVVFSVLMLIATFIQLLPRCTAWLIREPELTPTEMPASDELPRETVVVIAAAVAEVLSTPHRIVRIRGLTPADLGWSLEGRIQVHDPRCSSQLGDQRVGNGG